MYEDDQTAEQRMRSASMPTRTAARRSWRQEAVEELEELGDLYRLPEGLEVPL